MEMVNAVSQSMGNLHIQGQCQTQPAETMLAYFNDLILQHQDSAYNLACSLTGDPDLAEDITQKAFLNAYLHHKQFHGGSFLAWLLRIVKNACFDEFRRARCHPTFSLDAAWKEDDGRDSWLGVHTAGKSVSPEQVLEAKEQSAVIQRALDQLPHGWRAAVVLVDLEGLDYREAAQVTGCPLGTIKSRLARGRKRLGTLLAG